MHNRSNNLLLESEDCKISKLIISIVYAPLLLMLVVASIIAIS